MLVAVDGSAGAARAATVAFEVAEMTESRLTILHVVPTPAIQHFATMANEDAEEVLRRYCERGQQLLEGYRRAAEEYSIEVETVLERGLPSERIVSIAKKAGVDIVVLGSKGATGGNVPRTGSCTQRVIAGVNCTVIVAK